MDPPRYFSRHALAEIDRRCAAEFGLSSIVLMEHAATAVARAAVHEVGADPSRSVLVICGTGNNGGDGLAAARHLSNARLAVRVLLAGDPASLSPDAAINYRVAASMGIPIEGARDAAAALLRTLASPRPDLLIDAYLGTGARSVLRPPTIALITAINQAAAAGVPVLSVDLPSGLDCDMGEPLGAAVRATRTVALVGHKRGFRNPAAAAYTGRVTVGDIGAPRVLVESLADPPV